jgi:hypothetical protein
LRFSDHELLDYPSLTKSPTHLNRLQKFIKDSPILEVFSYNVPKKTYVLSTCIYVKDIMEALFQKLEDSPAEDIPYFILYASNLDDEKRRGGNRLITPFDFSVENNLTTNMKKFI